MSIRDTTDSVSRLADKMRVLGQEIQRVNEQQELLFRAPPALTHATFREMQRLAGAVPADVKLRVAGMAR